MARLWDRELRSHMMNKTAIAFAVVHKLHLVSSRETQQKKSALGRLTSTYVTAGKPQAPRVQVPICDVERPSW